MPPDLQQVTHIYVRCKGLACCRAGYLTTCSPNWGALCTACMQQRSDAESQAEENCREGFLHSVSPVRARPDMAILHVELIIVLRA